MNLDTIKIKGKDYVQVHTRVAHFRKDPNYSGWSLTSEIIEIDSDHVVMKAIIKDSQGDVIATGHAMEKFEGMINKNSGVENCETSAWGRALGCLGIGIESAIRSVEEMIKDKPNWWSDAIKYLNDGGTIDKIRSKYPVSKELEEELMQEAAAG